jgi:hypothetical protein
LPAIHLTKDLYSEYIRAQKTKRPSKINDPVKKWATELNRAFSKDEVKIAKKYWKKWSSFLAIKEMQIKAR